MWLPCPLCLVLPILLSTPHSCLVELIWIPFLDDTVWSITLLTTLLPHPGPVTFQDTKFPMHIWPSKEPETEVLNI